MNSRQKLFVFPILDVLMLGAVAASLTIHGVSSAGFALEQSARMLRINPSQTLASLQSAVDKKFEQLGDQSVTLSMQIRKDPSGSNIAHLTASYPYEIPIPLFAKYEGTLTRSAEVFLTVAR